MRKQKLIEEIHNILNGYGLTQQDYIISLQGPTVIPTVEGKRKLDENLCIKAELMHIGAVVLS
jgi:hypothetical protein